jgi:hypothetical protein
MRFMTLIKCAENSKIGPYAIFNVQSKQDAVEWAKRFLELHKAHWTGWQGETEVRQVMEAPGSGGGAAHA